MKYTVMKCECCGKIFHSEYWEGGYIDHVVNFVGNRNVYVCRNDVKDMAWEIVFDGNNIREIRYIEDFLECFMTWDCFQEDFKNKVKKIVNDVMKKINDAQAKATKILKTEDPLVLALLKDEKIDDAYVDIFDEAVTFISED